MKRAVSIVVVLAIAFSGYWFFGRPKAANAGTQYLTAAVGRGNVIASIAATGTVESALTYGLSFGQTTVTAASGTSSTSGSSGAGSNSGSNSNSSTTNLVSAVYVSVGQHVAAGTVLAQQDGTGSAAAVAAATAAVQVAQAQVANAQSQLQSTQLKIAGQPSTAAAVAAAKAQLAVDQAQLSADTAALGADTATLTSDLAAKPAKSAAVIAHDRLTVAKDDQSIVRDRAAIAADEVAVTTAANPASVQAANAAALAQAQAAVTQAQNGVVTAQANLKAAETTAAATTIKAPAAGVITAVNLTIGNPPSSSGYGIVLHSDNLAVVASVAEQDEPNLTSGLTANVTITSLNQVVTAKLQALPTAAASSSAGTGAVSFPVTFILDSNPEGLLPGMSATISVITATANNVIEVPTSAIQGTSPNYSVQVMSGGKPVSTPVNVGLTTNSLTEIISGLTVGQVVVTGTVSQTLTTTTTGGGLGGGSGRSFGGGGGGVIRNGGLGG